MPEAFWAFTGIVLFDSHNNPLVEDSVIPITWIRKLRLGGSDVLVSG